MTGKKKTRKRGPEPKVLVIAGDWKNAMARMLRTPVLSGTEVQPKAKKKRKGGGK